MSQPTLLAARPAPLAPGSRTPAVSGGRPAASGSRGLGFRCFVIGLAALAGALGIKALVVEVYSVPSGSMQPQILPGQRVAVDKLTYRFRDPARGEVVVFDGHGLFSDPAPGQNIFVKRVIGVGGDRVRCCDSSGRVSVNGSALDESDYLAAGVAPSQTAFDAVVPAGALWVMGDRRDSSADSRSYVDSPSGGFIPAERVRGRAALVVWPTSDAQWVSTPDTVEPSETDSGGS